MKNIFRRMIPTDWIRDWGVRLLESEGHTIIKINVDVLIISAVDSRMALKNEMLNMRSGSMLGVVFTHGEPIDLTIYPPFEIKI